MTPNRFAFLVLGALITLAGLFLAAAARDLPLSIFAWGLVLFGILFDFSLIKRTYDEADAQRRAH